MNEDKFEDFVQVTENLPNGKVRTYTIVSYRIGDANDPLTSVEINTNEYKEIIQ